VTSRREDLAAVALESQQAAVRFPLKVLLADKSHSKATRWAWKRSYAALLVAARARLRISVTDNSQGPGGDVRSMPRYSGEDNPPITQIEPLPKLTP